MAISEIAGGSQSATINTEHTLSTQTTNGTYVLVIDTTNLVNGDLVELRLKTKSRTGEASTLAYFAIFANAQDSNIKYSIPVPVNIEIVATLKQTVGTGRSFTWALIKIDA